MKRCSKCHQLKQLHNFGKRKTSRDGKQGKCKTYVKEYAKIWYETNKDNRRAQIKTSNKLAKIRNQEFIIDYLSKHPCIDCGNTDIRVLEFDHLYPQDKKYNISNLILESCSLMTLKKEIQKCVIRCSNCHKIRTQQQFNHWKSKYAGGSR